MLVTYKEQAIHKTLRRYELTNNTAHPVESILDRMRQQNLTSLIARTIILLKEDGTLG